MNDEQSIADASAEVESALEEVFVSAVKLQQEGRIEGAGRKLEQIPDHGDTLNFLGVAK